MKFPGDNMNKAPKNESFTIPKGLTDYIDRLLDRNTSSWGRDRHRKLTKEGQEVARLIHALGIANSNAEIKKALIKALGDGAISGQDYLIMIGFFRDENPKP